MIIRAEPSKGLIWAGRITVLAIAAFVLPLAPSWAQNNKSTSTMPDGLAFVDSQSLTETKRSQSFHQEANKPIENRVAEELKKDPELIALSNEIEKARERVRSSDSARASLIKSLQQQLVALRVEIELKRSQLRDLSKKGNVIIKPEDRPNTVNSDGTGVKPTFKTVPETHVQQMMAEIDRNELALIEATSMLDVMREVNKARREENPKPAQVNEGELLARIKDEFKKDPDVLALKQEFDEMREHLDHPILTLPYPQDASRIAAQKRFKKLQQEYSDLWNSKYEEIRERLTAEGSGGDIKSLAKIRELEQKVEALKQKKTKLAELFKAIQVEQKATKDDTFEAAILNHHVQSLLNWEELVKRNLKQLKLEASQDAAEKQLSTLVAQYDNLRKSKHDQLLAQLTKDDKKKDDNTGEKASEAVNRLQEKVKELVDKLSKELSPVAEEVRKTLEQAVGDIRKSLEKEGLSAEELRKAFDKTQQDLRKAFEGGGPVDKELREGIDKARKDMQDAFDRTRGDVQNQVDALRQRPHDQSPRDLSGQMREEGRFRDVEKEPNHNPLESARQEIRNLEERLRAATRRLELLEQRESRGGSPSRRTEPKGTTPTPAPPRNETLRPETPARPPTAERGRVPGRGGRGGMMGRPQTENERRLRELEDKMNLLLKELESLKGNKNPEESRGPGSRNVRPAKPLASPINS